VTESEIFCCQVPELAAWWRLKIPW